MKLFLLLICLLLFTAACSHSNSATLMTVQNASVENGNTKTVVTIENVSVDDGNTKKTEVSNSRISKTLDCRKPNKYRLVVVENPNRKNQAEPVMPKDLNIVVGNEVVAKIELPIPDSEAKNFSLNSVKKTKTGFEMKAEWGGGLYHYEVEFDFRCKENSFYLYKVKNENFSTKNPDSGSYWDEKETKITKFEPNLPIEKFVMLDYLQ